MTRDLTGSSMCSCGIDCRAPTSACPVLARTYDRWTVLIPFATRPAHPCTAVSPRSGTQSPGTAPGPGAHSAGLLLTRAKLENPAERIYLGARPAGCLVPEEVAEAGLHVVEASSLGREVEGFQHVAQGAAPGLKFLLAVCGLGQLGRYGSPQDVEEALPCGDPPRKAKVIERFGQGQRRQVAGKRGLLRESDEDIK
jgi:hypothetical protein